MTLLGDALPVGAPDTVTEAVALLERLGYASDFTLAASSVHCHSCDTLNSPSDLRLVHRFRFEGPTDPADEAIVLGVECGECAAKGVIVSAYGPLADGDLLTLVNRRTQRA